MKARVDFDLPASGRSGVSIEGDALELELDLEGMLDDAGAAIAEAVVRDARATGKWNRTGTLLGGIASERDGKSVAVVVPPGRLATPELRERFARDVAAARDPLNDRRVDSALSASLDKRVR